MGKVAFEDQNPGDVKYGSFSVAELEAMGFSPMHSEVEALQALTKAKKNIRYYRVGLNNYASLILRHLGAYTEFEHRMAMIMDLAADELREIDPNSMQVKPGIDIPNMPTRDQIIVKLEDYISFLTDHPDCLAPDKADHLRMVVRLLKDGEKT